MLIPLLLTIGMICWMPFYIWSEYNWKQNKFLITKLICSSLFVLIGISSVMVLDAPNEYGTFMIIALILGLIGDGFLVFSNNQKAFIVGLSSFLLGQIIYGTVFLKFNGFIWYDLIVYFGVLAICFIIYKISKLQFGEMKKPIILYFIIIIYMFTMASSSVYKEGFSSITTILIVVGGTLFLASDIILAFIIFDEKTSKSFKALNLTYYYVAQTLLALSIYSYGVDI